MRMRAARSRIEFCTALFIVIMSVLPAAAFAPRQAPARFDGLAKPAPDAVIGVTGAALAALPASDGLRRDWERFVSAQGGGWDAYVDERSGLPTLARGRGIAWIPAGTADADVDLGTLEQLARAFAGEHPELLGRFGPQMVLDRAASGLSGQVWQVVFRQHVNGVPVRGARYDFQVAAGNLVAFGATRWSEVRTSTTPAFTVTAARAALDAYLAAAPGLLREIEPARLELLPREAGGTSGTAWRGARGAGYDHELVWHFVLQVPDESPTWVGDVDAQTGRVVALYDDTRYTRVKGGVYPLSNDGIGPEGTENPNYPLPFADIGSATANDAGVFSCSGNSTTTLAGPYIEVSDKCGAVSQSSACPSDLDLGSSAGTDCVVPPGGSVGNTHAARSSFYHLNRVMEKGRTWLPANSWLKSQVIDNVNIVNTCNAYWNGSVNFFRSGGGCRNTGELQGVFVHEWGHGLDANDGGGYDNPSEAYADIVAVLEGRESCAGRGFYMNGNCSGYGDACLACSGIRDQDWGKHARNTPATPQNFLAVYCGGGDGPCGREGHCESYVSAEAVYDLAARDLPAMGLDAATAWQLTEKLWYLSRSGSGGNAYNCALPSADGCGTNSWFHKFLVQDDNDGNLSNGTPHAAAIFSAFARHGIACGAAADPSNQNAIGCSALAKPTLNVEASSSQVKLTWSTVGGTSKYTILRNDTGCNRGQVIIDRVGAPATSYTDTGLAGGMTVYYRVQAQASNSACEGPVSDCVAASTPAAAGTVSFGRDAYACGTSLALRVLDGNTGSTSVVVKVSSTTESQPETVTLTQTASGSGNYVGSIATATTPAANGDGVLSVSHGDTLAVEYVDADDGAGGTNVTRSDTAAADCFAPVIANVHAVNVTDTQATIVWDTDEPATSSVTWGATAPPQLVAASDALVTHHEVALVDLAPCAVYYFTVRSDDRAGNVATADDGGASYHLQTLGNFGSGPEICRRAVLGIDQAAPNCGALLTFNVTDADLDRDPAHVETATVRVSSSTETDPEPVTITETAIDAPRFSGSIRLASGTPARDGKLQVKDGDVVTVSFYDADDGHGHAAWRSLSVVADCRGPRIHNVTVDGLTNARGTIRFTSDEPGSTVVDWGTTPALGQRVSVPDLVTDHAVALNQFDTCQAVYLRVRSTDASGNESVSDAGGTPYAFRTWNIPGLYWRDTFENSSGWNLAGEWEIAAPQGKGGATFGVPDPAAAYNNGKVLGDDLTGRGAAPGDYENNVSDKAASPTLNATSWHRTKLLFARQLNAGPGDEASVYVCSGSCSPVYRTGSQAVSDTAWSVQSYDVSALVDGKSNLRLEFRQNAPLGNGAGWTVDDVIFKDAAQPDFAACGACAQAPSFGGAVSATDDDACAASGVTITWEPAPGWGSGSSGSYAVYRGTAPGFAADAAHRVAAGIKALSYDDATAPAGALYYLVRAENDEACGGGPANGGATDTNAVYVPVTQTTGQSTPGIVTLGATLVNHAHVRLSWAVPPAASSFRVYRSSVPQAAGFAPQTDTAQPAWEDLGQGSDTTSHYYLVRGVNACGTEGP